MERSVIQNGLVIKQGIVKRNFSEVINDNNESNLETEETIEDCVCVLPVPEPDEKNVDRDNFQEPTPREFIWDKAKHSSE